MIIIYMQAMYTKLKQSINKPSVSYKTTTRQNRSLVFHAHEKYFLPLPNPQEHKSKHTEC